MPAELLAALLVGCGTYLLVTALPWGAPRPSLAERLRRFDVDARLAERSPLSLAVRPLLPWHAGDAVLRPLLEDLAGLVRRLFGGGGVFGGTIERDLRRLRPGVEPIQFLAEQLLWAGLAATAMLAVLLASGALGPAGLLLAGMLALLGFLWPPLRLRAEAHDRRRRILAELPQVVRLLAVAVSAGLVPDAALERVARRSAGVFGTELRRVHQEVAAGQRRLMEALAALAEREDVPEVAALVAQLRAADEQGLPLVAALETMATGLRERQAIRLLEAGEKGSVRMVLPLGLVLVPVMLLVALVPGYAALRGLAGP